MCESGMDVAVLYSGGKDSNLAAYRAKREGHVIRCLVTVIPQSAESYMFHYPNTRHTALQAEAMGLPLLTRRTAGLKEKELEDLEEALVEAKIQHGIEGVFAGAVASNYQKSRVEKICRATGLECFSPLWRKDPESLLRETIRLGFATIITCVSAEGLDQSWLGRQIDLRAVEELKELNLKYGVNIVFEGGEAETFVLDGPLFSGRIEIVESQKTWRHGRGSLEILKARLVEK
ncbi:MAG: TIGR00289 family protein [Aigarchaeota archaeon]|nr:TIGR00289 family protein [Aigarchaeota archaeon]MDH5704149.1 TIGR00289 family protein [Aigarchaeota archaeon]